jgi:hypothetical protein
MLGVLRSLLRASLWLDAETQERCYLLDQLPDHFIETFIYNSRMIILNTVMDLRLPQNVGKFLST